MKACLEKTRNSSKTWRHLNGKTTRTVTVTSIPPPYNDEAIVGNVTV